MLCVLYFDPANSSEIKTLNNVNLVNLVFVMVSRPLSPLPNMVVEVLSLHVPTPLLFPAYVATRLVTLQFMTVSVL